MRGRALNISSVVLLCSSLRLLPNTLVFSFGLSPSAFHWVYSLVFFYNRHFLSLCSISAALWALAFNTNSVTAAVAQGFASSPVKTVSDRESMSSNSY